MDWYCVRAVFAFDGVYEERMTLWQAADFTAAITLAGQEASTYAAELDGGEFTGLLQAYALDDRPGHGAEVFSLMRTSPLSTDDYLSTFFDTGAERQNPVDPGSR
ncbi:hypothetical protein GCM10010168_24070 [Actinoplanes ianthinogenes]|uniref:DUF4288 domain-containing protein n=1 Tax=Actinoplanes ianthinogenes TaxID=122358 RepID=A0ABN6CUE3_9ACTN|nr:hypothetical protein [Actinoplanes ianthinogenes]BCJ48047.1 hypothetical protein Aiant_87040 [Actinoplanes ianthinogenes]GGR06023.1 hypothetical protein GCM10010168_24070 [Actinoplanes ianthinogenes]